MFRYLFVATMGLSLLSACAGNLPEKPSESFESTYAFKPSNFRISLTDAPKQDVKAVYVDIKHVELWLEKSGKEGRLILGEKLGKIDLLKLRNGVLLPIADLKMPSNITIKQIRVVLQSTGHSLVKEDDSVCELQTPSAQHTGIKILVNPNVTVDPKYAYAMVVDFDAEKSTVQKGNGECGLKPVLKLKKFARAPMDDIDENGNSTTPEEDVTGPGEEGNDDTMDDGYDLTDPSTLPDDLTPEDLESF